MHILVLNSGSSTLKYTLFSGDGPDALASGTISVEGKSATQRDATSRVFEHFEGNDEVQAAVAITRSTPFGSGGREEAFEDSQVVLFLWK